jgi:hypothetical protein
MLASFSSLSTHGPHQRSHNHTHHTSTPNAHTHRLSHCSSTFPPTAYRLPPTHAHAHSHTTPSKIHSTSQYALLLLLPSIHPTTTPTDLLFYTNHSKTIRTLRPLTRYLLPSSSYTFLLPSSFFNSNTFDTQTQSTSSRQITASWLCDATNLSSQSLTPTPTRTLRAITCQLSRSRRIMLQDILFKSRQFTIPQSVAIFSGTAR